MEPVEILIKARELISAPERWTQEEFARDDNGHPLTWGYNPMAVCWCALGAIEHVVGESGFGGQSHNEAEMWLDNIANSQGLSVGGVNDKKTHAEVLALFDRAIASATPAPGHEDHGTRGVE